MSNRTIQLFLVIASSILNLVATDILLPSLPQMAKSFAVSATDVKMLISFFMLGQFATVLIWGIVADKFGKRRALLFGMLVFLAGSLLSLRAHSINLLLLCRLLQGAGGVVVPVAGWALVQDLFPKNESARIMAWIGTLVAIIPLFAPALGGKIDVLYGWQTNLYCIAIASAILCLCFILLPGNNQGASQLNNPSLKTRLHIYTVIIRNKTFISYITLFGLLNCGEWCFLTVAPFYYHHVHIPADKMGLLLMLTSIGFVIGSLLASKLIKCWGIDKTIILGIQLAICSSCLLLVGEYSSWSEYQYYNATDLALYILSSALLWSGTTSRALQCFADYRGAASAIRSLILLCFASLGTYVGSLLDHTSLYPIGFFLLLTAVAALKVFYNKELKSERLSEDIAY
ncbi:MAG: MFS transporter [bacterium]|nr:MFS transporter [bacterium]